MFFGGAGVNKYASRSTGNGREVLMESLRNEQASRSYVADGPVGRLEGSSRYAMLCREKLGREIDKLAERTRSCYPLGESTSRLYVLGLRLRQGKCRRGLSG